MSSIILRNKSHEWEEKIQQQLQSGLPATRWCQQQQIPYNAFAYWKRRFIPISPLKRESFIELSDRPSKNGIELEYNNIRVRLDKDFDAVTLKRCLQILKETLC
jgi:hypothetical protein